MHVLANNPAQTTGATNVQFDNDGFLIDQYDWNKTVANQIANDEGVTLLTDKHWQVIHYIRDYFSRLNAMPPPRRICRQLGIEGHDIKAMFGSCITVWRIAGLPHPGDEAMAYMH